MHASGSLRSGQAQLPLLISLAAGNELADLAMFESAGSLSTGVDTSLSGIRAISLTPSHGSQNVVRPSEPMSVCPQPSPPEIPDGLLGDVLPLQDLTGLSRPAAAAFSAPAIRSLFAGSSIGDLVLMVALRTALSAQPSTRRKPCPEPATSTIMVIRFSRMIFWPGTCRPRPCSALSRTGVAPSGTIAAVAVTVLFGEMGGGAAPDRGAIIALSLFCILLANSWSIKRAAEGLAYSSLLQSQKRLQQEAD